MSLMEVYYKELQKIKLLSESQERKLWIKFKEKDSSEARQRIIRFYQPLVFKIVKQYSSERELMLELIQEGNLGLIDAVDNFDHQRGVKFSTFAVYHIRGRIKTFFKNGVELEPFLTAQPEELLDNRVEKNYLLERVGRVIRELSVKEQKVLKEIYLMNKEPQVLASEMGISLSYLYRLQKKAIRRIRGKLSVFIKKWE